MLTVWVARGDEGYGHFAGMLFNWTYVSIVIAMIAGLADAGGFKHLNGGLGRHFYAALLALIVYTIRAILQKQPPCRVKPEMRLAGSAVAVAAIFITAYLGGLLVYR